MNILVITQYYPPEPFKVSDICEELVNRGHSVTVLTGIPNYPSGKIYDGYQNKQSIQFVNGVKVFRCKLRPRKQGKANLLLNYLSFWKNSKKAARKLKEKFDVVYVWEISPIFYLSAAHLYAKKNKTKVICYCMDLWPESLKVVGVKEKSLIFKLTKKISKRMYGYCDEIIVSSPSFSDYLRTYIGYKGKLEYLPQHYSPKFELLPKKESTRKLFVYAGNIGSSQLIENICKAFKHIDADLWIYGSGSHLDICKSVVDELSLTNVKICGLVKREELQEAYSLADCFVLPLLNSTFVGRTIPAKLQEYVYYAKPILAAIDGDAKDVLNEIGSASFCDLTKEETIISGANKLLEEFDIFKNNAEHGKEYFEKRFTLKQHVDCLIKRFEETV